MSFARSILGTVRLRRVPLAMAGLIVVFAMSFAAPRVLAAGNCTVAHLGVVCDTASWSGYNAEYINHTGQCFWADFNLQTTGYQGGPSGTYGDNGSFWTCDGQYNSYFFAVGFQGCSQVIVYDRSNGQLPQSSGGSSGFNTCDPN
jgi:hypothetical protein